MRIALGAVAGENDVTIMLTGPSVHLLDADTDDLVDGDDIAKFRETLKKLGVPFHVEQSAMADLDSDWNAEGHPLVQVAPDEIAALVGTAERFIIF